MDDMGKVGPKSVPFSKVGVVSEALRRCGYVPGQHVFGVTFSLFLSGGCPAPALDLGCAHSQPHQTLSSHLSIFPHCAQR